jgi:hypothetical protein
MHTLGPELMQTYLPRCATCGENVCTIERDLIEHLAGAHHVGSVCRTTSRAVALAALARHLGNVHYPVSPASVEADVVATALGR